MPMLGSPDEVPEANDGTVRPVHSAVLTPEERLAAQYAGPKERLRPIYDKLVAAIRTLGSDVSINPLQTYTAVLRRHQFAVIYPATETQLDLGLALPGIEAIPPLKITGRVGGAATTHRIDLHSPDEVDDDVFNWLKVAYDLDASPRA